MQLLIRTYQRLGGHSAKIAVVISEVEIFCDYAGCAFLCLLTNYPDASSISMCGLSREFDVGCVWRMQVGHRNVASLAGTDEAAQGGMKSVESHISHIVFSGDGAALATVDVHPSAAASGPVGSALKFWDRRSSGAAAGGGPLYSLNSHISEPHRCDPISWTTRSRNIPMYWIPS